MVPRDLVYKFLRSLEAEGARPATVDAYRRAYTWFWTFLQKEGIKAEKARITRAHISTWVKEMHAKGLKPASIKVRLAALSKFFQWLQREGHVKGNPVAMIPRPKVRAWSPRGILTPFQAAKFWTEAESDLRNDAHYYRVGILLFWQSGGRITETLMTDWQDLTLAVEKPVWHLKHGKGGKERWVPIPRHSLLYKHLILLWERRDRPIDGPVLLSRTGKRLSRTSLYDAVKFYARRAGIPHVSPHWFRHTWATELVLRAKGLADLWRVMKWAGHADISTTQLYVHILDDDRYLSDLTFGQ